MLLELFPRSDPPSKLLQAPFHSLSSPTLSASRSSSSLGWQSPWWLKDSSLDSRHSLLTLRSAQDALLSTARWVSRKCCCHSSQQKTAIFSVSYYWLWVNSGSPWGWLPGLSWGVQWRRAWASIQSLPLWNGSENLEKGQQYQGHKGLLSRQAQQGDNKEVSLSQACSSAKANNKMQDHEYVFAHERKEKGPRGSWVLPPSPASPLYRVSFKPKSERQTERRLFFTS